MDEESPKPPRPSPNKGDAVLIAVIRGEIAGALSGIFVALLLGVLVARSVDIAPQWNAILYGAAMLGALGAVPGAVSFAILAVMRRR